jgi:hypothetical protein
MPLETNRPSSTKAQSSQAPMTKTKTLSSLQLDIDVPRSIPLPSVCHACSLDHFRR